VATRAPKQRYSQPEVLDELSDLGFGQDRRARIIFARSGVEHRHFVVDRDFYSIEQTTQARNERYLDEALPLGEAAVCACLDAAGYPPQAVDDFLVVSCTGFDIPGLDLRLAGRLGMRPDLRRTNVLGMGCYGAFPALLRAREAASSGAERLVLVLALELCSLHFQHDETVENIITSALFADGAAAALVGVPAAESHAPGFPRLVDSATYCDYQTVEHMAFHVTDHGFHMRLSAYVPDLLAANIEQFADGLLARNHLTREDVRFWGVHPGSRKILDYVQSRLGLTASQMEYSRAVLREYGNMSSATILFILEAIQRSGQPKPGDYGMLLGFGPGLTSEGLLLQW
jgi:predicted naringenin-chalcone synthase